MYAAAGATAAYGGSGATGTFGAAGATGAYGGVGLKKGKLFFVHTILLYCSVSESLYFLFTQYYFIGLQN